MKTVGNLYVKIAREVLAHKFSDLDAAAREEIVTRENFEEIEQYVEAEDVIRTAVSRLIGELSMYSVFLPIGYMDKVLHGASFGTSVRVERIMKETRIWIALGVLESVDEELGQNHFARTEWENVECGLKYLMPILDDLHFGVKEEDMIDRYGMLVKAVV